MPINFCKKCEGPNTWKPVRAHHCSTCNRCVFKLDHFCPWINNAVGHRNSKYYYLFVLYSMFASWYLALLMVITFCQLLASKKPKQHMNHPNYPYVFLMCIGAFVLGLLFGYFSFSICQE